MERETKFFKSRKKRILRQMFDVRPVNELGELDFEKIQQVEKTARLREDSVSKNEIYQEEPFYFLEAPKKERRISEELPILNENFENVKNVSLEFRNENYENTEEREKIYNNDYHSYSYSSDSAPKNKWFSFIREKLTRVINFDQLVKIFSAVAAIFLVFFAFDFINIGLKMKNGGMDKSRQALAILNEAQKSIQNQNFFRSESQFANAYMALDEISKELDKLPKVLVASTKYFPYLSKLTSADHMIKAGKDISTAGIEISRTLQLVDEIKNPTQDNEESLSYLKIFKDTQEKLKNVSVSLESAEENIKKVNIDDIPEDSRDKIIALKSQLPQINATLSGFFEKENILLDILGGNGPRKYLFLFQNNQEMRATGGFIGSYGLLDIFQGRIRNFFIDGIFNPDGQLKTRIVPPAPMQKVSANWSLHDSNWFPDFPLSAEKAIWFYEKTGGPTVDGVITMTPTVMQKLLEITGPIELSEYGVTVDKDNFIKNIQYEVEVDYDKELNQPKKILADLAPKILDKIFNFSSLENASKTIDVLLESLNQKHILIYSKNWEIEKVLSENAWSGEMLNTGKDYLSVINTNVNGFKTDGVVSEEISLKSNIEKDGTIINTLIITRKHNGGDTQYDWWNRVNSDYMRVYVPQGSKLISATGHTREFNSAPLDYSALGYARDSQVEMEESLQQIDEETGTKIYQDAGKTVFANWVYVSPKETVRVEYTYALPFKLDFEKADLADTYSLLAQKQSGSLGSRFVNEIEYPSAFKTLWEYPEKGNWDEEILPNERKRIRMETNLETDKFTGVALSQ